MDEAFTVGGLGLHSRWTRPSQSVDEAFTVGGLALHCRPSLSIIVISIVLISVIVFNVYGTRSVVVM